MKKKSSYYLSLMGTVFLSFIPITSIILFLILLIHSIINDPEAVGYVVLFMFLPVSIFAIISSVIPILTYLTLPSSFYNGKQRVVSILHLIIGFISACIAPLYIYAINYLMKMTFYTTGFLTDFLDVLEYTDLHPIKIIWYSLYFISPILLFLGGLLHLMDYLKQRDNV